MAVITRTEEPIVPEGQEHQGHNEPIVRSLLYHTLTELRDPDLTPPIDQVTGLVAEGETVLLVGRPKVGKSRLVLQLVFALSAGKEVLGFRIPRARRILLLDLENRPVIVRDRFRHMAPEPRDSDENIVIYTPETLSTSMVGIEGEGLSWLRELVEHCNPDILVIDTWRLLLGAKDENKSDVVVSGLKDLAKLRESRPSLSIVIVHHLRKQQIDSRVSLRVDPYGWVESVSGHHALVGHVDACYGIEREVNDSEELIVFGGIARVGIRTEDHQ